MFMSVHVCLCISVSVCVCVYLHVNIRACNGQKEMFNPIKLVILVIMF